MANLAGEAGRVSGLSGDEVVTVRRAGLLHDLGRLGVPNTVWDRAGPLPPAAFERVPLHPYLTDRMLAPVTAREVEVLGYLARGHSNKQIAQRLVVAPKTVSNHVEHIYTKLGVSSRAAATLFATQHGLLGTFESA